MTSFLEKIRRQPRAIQNKIIYYIVGLVVTMLIVFWLIVGSPAKNGYQKEQTGIVDKFKSELQNSKDFMKNNQK